MIATSILDSLKSPGLLLTGPLLKVAILSNKSKKTQKIKTKIFKKINPTIQKETPNLKKTRQQAKKNEKYICKTNQKVQKKSFKKVPKKTKNGKTNEKKSDKIK